MADCFKRVRAELRKSFPASELPDDVIKNVVEEVQRLKKTDDFRGASQKYRDKLVRMSAAQMRERAENMLKTTKRMNFYTQSAFKDKPVDAMLARFEGSDVLAEGGRLSVYARQQRTFQRLHHNLYYGLEEAGVLEAVQSGAIDKQIMQELFEARPGGRVGISGSAEAQKAAKAIRDVQTQMLTDLREAGIDIGEIPGYVMSQSHAREKINPNVKNMDGDFKAWFAEIAPKLDEKTFDGVTDRTEFMRAIFDDIASGRRGHTATEGVSDELITVTKGGSQNLSRQLGRSRVLHFKSGADFFEYNQKFGTNDLMQSVMGTIATTARTVGLAEAFGTNPRAAVAADMVRLGIKAEDGAKIDMALKEAEGATQVPGRSVAARAFAGARAVAQMAKLGRAALASTTDLSIGAGSIRSATGKNYFNALGDGIRGYAENMMPSDRKQFYKMVQYGADDLLAGMNNRFSLDNGPGFLSKANEIYFKLNYVHAQASTARASAASAVSRHYAEEFSTKAWSELPSQSRGLLQGFYLNESNWDVVKQAVQTLPDGRKFWTPEALEAMPDSAFRGLKEFATPAKARRELSVRVGAMLADVAETGSPLPGAKQRRQLLRGHSADSPEGMFLRMITQFKSFPMAMHSVVKRGLLNDPEFQSRTILEGIKSGEFDGQNALGFAFVGTGVAYLSLAAGNLMAGREPPDPTNPKTWAESLVRSGTAGLYGDFLLGEYDQMYKSALKDIAGPTLGQMDDVAELWASAVRGEPRASKALRLLKNNTPGQNLFYTKAATDYLIWWRLNEMLNPGYLRRMKRRAEREGSPYIIDPMGAR